MPTFEEKLKALRDNSQSATASFTGNGSGGDNGSFESRLASVRSAAPPTITPPPTDVRSQIAARRDNPPPTQFGDPNGYSMSALEQAAPYLAHPVNTASGFLSALNPLPMLQKGTGPVTSKFYGGAAIDSDWDARMAALHRLQSRGSKLITDDPASPESGEDLRSMFEFSVPVLGPAIANAGRKMNSTDPHETARGFGQAVAVTSGPKITKNAVKLSKAVFRRPTPPSSPSSSSASGSGGLSNPRFADLPDIWDENAGAGSIPAGSTAPIGTMPIYGEPVTTPPSIPARFVEYAAREAAGKVPVAGTFLSDLIKGRIAGNRTTTPQIGNMDLSQTAAYGDAQLQPIRPRSVGPEFDPTNPHIEIGSTRSSMPVPYAVPPESIGPVPDFRNPGTSFPMQPTPLDPGLLPSPSEPMGSMPLRPIGDWFRPIPDAVYGDAPNQPINPFKPRQVGQVEGLDPVYDERFQPNRNQAVKSHLNDLMLADSKQAGWQTSSSPTSSPASTPATTTTTAAPPSIAPAAPGAPIATSAPISAGGGFTVSPFTEGDAVILPGGNAATIIDSTPEFTTIRSGSVTTRVSTPILRRQMQSVETAAPIVSRAHPIQSTAQPLQPSRPVATAAPAAPATPAATASSSIPATALTPISTPVMSPQDIVINALDPNALMDIGQLRSKLAAELPGQQFDKALLDAQMAGRIDLHQHPTPSVLTPAQRASYVLGPGRDIAAIERTNPALARIMREAGDDRPPLYTAIGRR